MAEKKKKNTKTKSKKTTKVVEEKKSFRDVINSVPFLIGVMIFLVVLIGFLGVLIYQKEEKKREEFDAHITIPVLKISSNFEFGVDTSLLLKEDNQEYIFKIVNYRGEDMANIEIPYKIIIENPTNAVIELTKGDDKTNLITSQEKTELEEVMPLSEEEEEFYYHLKIVSHGKLKTNDFVSIQIVS